MNTETIEQVLFDVADNGFLTEESGSVDEGMWYGLIIGKSHTFIITEDNYGFKSWDGYSKEEGTTEWERILSIVERNAGPAGGDITTEDHIHFYMYHKLILTVDDAAGDYEQELNDWMNEHGYFPNVWFIDDHGGHTLLEVV